MREVIFLADIVLDANNTWLVLSVLMMNIENRNAEFTDMLRSQYQAMSEKSVSAINRIASALDSIPREITTVHHNNEGNKRRR